MSEENKEENNEKENMPEVETTLYRMNGTLMNIKKEIETSNDNTLKIVDAINKLNDTLIKCNWNFGSIAENTGLKE